CLELGGEPRALALLQVAEDLDAIEAVLGNFGFHRWSCWPYSLGGQPSSCPRIREPDDPDTRQLLRHQPGEAFACALQHVCPRGGNSRRRRQGIGHNLATDAWAASS